MRRLSVLLFVFCCICFHSISHAGQSEQVFTVGIVPQFEARKLHSIWRPILDQVETRTGYQFRLIGSQTIPDFEIEFIQGKFDFAYMNPYHLVIANQKAGYIPLVRDVGRELFGILVVAKNSGINDPTELNGKTVVFPAPNALGASLQMRQELHDKFGVTVKPKYVKTHDSVYLNVLIGAAAAGGGVQKTLQSQKQKYQNNLKIIHTTTRVPPHPFAVLPGVPLEIQQRVQEAFLSLGKEEAGRILLEKVPIKKIGVASLDDYTPLLHMGLERYYKQP
ncbi:phosphate/phosphite/phosphonate ABC transporter substrate-binding protein [Desulfogranum japonicum]|uniref:phosphate/phosphite/phosphonate ABC transporter substrate-binding protein n=1 Tax=Desulfogranum japonicum TaxID=231447 RepID=UPI000415C76D|nr:phosphate/phosphite/phosphonate ABC transporter substrate-binding protein [Desulfogranum japonicum]